jgi:small subunit ribosomal protein S2
MLKKYMLELGVHIGHSVDSVTCYAGAYILGMRNKRAIIDLDLTIWLMKQSMYFLKELAKRGGSFLFHHSQWEMMPLMMRLYMINLVSIHSGNSIVESKWQYGQWSSFYTQALERLMDFSLSKKRTFNVVRLFTKLMRFSLSKVIPGMSWKWHWHQWIKYWRFFNQFKYYNNFRKTPDVMILVSPNNKWTAAREAASVYSPVIGLLDTNSMQVPWVSYGIPSNDDSSWVVLFFTQLWVNSYLTGKIVS